MMFRIWSDFNPPLDPKRPPFSWKIKSHSHCCPKYWKGNLILSWHLRGKCIWCAGRISILDFYIETIRTNTVKALPDHGVSTVFVKLENTNLELLEPLGEKSPIAKFLEKKPSGGMHHICIEVDDIHGAISSLLDQGIKPIDPNPKIGAHGKPVVFLNPRDCNGVLIELEEK